MSEKKTHKTVIRYKLWQVTEDGLLKRPQISLWNVMSEYTVFDSMEQALEYCENHDLAYLTILPFIDKVWND